MDYERNRKGQTGIAYQRNTAYKKRVETTDKNSKQNSFTRLMVFQCIAALSLFAVLVSIRYFAPSMLENRETSYIYTDFTQSVEEVISYIQSNVADKD